MVDSVGFTEYGFSSKMGPQLRRTVEQELRADLMHYGIAPTNLRFDWSQSCLEGHCIAWLDGDLEDFSGIALLDQQGQAVVEGWMEFIVVSGSQLLVYWDNLTSWDADGEHRHKEEFGIPPHIWARIPVANQPHPIKYLMRKPPFTDAY